MAEKKISKRLIRTRFRRGVNWVRIISLHWEYLVVRRVLFPFWSVNIFYFLEKPLLNEFVIFAWHPKIQWISGCHRVYIRFVTYCRSSRRPLTSRSKSIYSPDSTTGSLFCPINLKPSKDTIVISDSMKIPKKSTLTRRHCSSVSYVTFNYAF